VSASHRVSPQERRNFAGMSLSVRRMRTALVGLLLLGCTATARPIATPGPSTAGNVEVDRATPDAEVDPVAAAETIFMRAEMEHPARPSHDDANALQRAGMTEPIAIAALSACMGDSRAPRCLASEQAESIVEWLADHGTMRSARVLYARDHAGLIVADRALDDVLARSMVAEAGPCTPPDDDEIQRAREDLTDFVVVDRVRDDRLVARVLDAGELDDLAYFMAAVRFAGPEITESHGGFRSGLVPERDELERRVTWLAEIDDARKVGDLATVQSRGYAYIESLGYPGELDLSREGEMTWGGARGSQLMREVAIASEIVGELDVAASLWQRANPGGGMCGTSVGYRWQKQVQGFIRARERSEGCRAVVAERMLDIDGDFDDASPYGPARLVQAGFDLAKLYRGALLTRNRDLDPTAVRDAIERAPATIRAAAQARWTKRGPEAWEARVRAVQGAADELGRAGVDLLLAHHEAFAAPVRARAITAIGSAAARTQVGPCEDGWIHLRGFSIGGPWERSVHMFGKECATRLSDHDATALTKRLRAHLDAEEPDIRAAALYAIGEIAAPRSLQLLRRRLARAEADLARCRAADPDDCHELDRVRDAAQSAIDNVVEVVARR
jgi:hypothetical protein